MSVCVCDGVCVMLCVLQEGSEWVVDGQIVEDACVVRLGGGDGEHAHVAIEPETDTVALAHAEVRRTVLTTANPLVAITAHYKACSVGEALGVFTCNAACNAAIRSLESVNDDRPTHQCTHTPTHTVSTHT